MGYKVGDKFVIEIDEIFRSKSNGELRYKMKGFNTLMFDDTGLDKLEPLKPDTCVLRQHNIEITDIEAYRITNMAENYIVTPTPEPASVQYHTGDIVKFSVRDEPQHFIRSNIYNISAVDTNGYYTILHLT